MPENDGQILERLARIEAQQLQILSMIERLAPVGAISREDRRRLTVMLPTLVEVFGTAAFLAVDVINKPRLRALCPVGKKDRSKSLGKFYSRVEGVRIAGQSLERRGEESGSLLWGVASFGLSGLTTTFKAA